MFHELNCYRAYEAPDLQLSYWALSTGTEVDFVCNDGKVAIEAKSSTRIHSEHLKGLIEFAKEHPHCKKRYVVSLEPKARLHASGIEILPYTEFIERLWSGKLIT